MSTEQQIAWAIDTGDDQRAGFLGRFYFSEDQTRLFAPVLQVRIWESREGARDALRKERLHSYQAFPKAKVVRVRVTVETVK